MSERRQRLTRPLSRETAQIMLQMKDLLRKYGITISLSAPNVYDMLFQAVEETQDEEISLLYQRLLDDLPSLRELPENEMCLDEESPFIDDVEEAPVTRAHATKPLMVSKHASAPLQGSPFAELPPNPGTSRNAYGRETEMQEDVDVFLKRDDQSTPVTKRVALQTPRTGLLRCDQCQRANTVRAAASREEAIEVRCTCGMIYRVILDARKFDRKVVNLSGTYVNQNDDTKTGTVVIENISLGGVKMHVTSEHNIMSHDRLYIQFTLDDKMQTLIWSKLRVHYVHDDIVGAEFIDLAELNKTLSAYLMR